MKFLQQHVGIIIKLIFFTLFSILVRGYQYGSGNQVHYFNFAFHKFYPEFFANDYLFKIHDLPYTIFVDALYAVLRIFGENPFIFFLIYFLFLFLFYLAIYLIADYFFKNKKLSILMLLFFIFPIPIGGSTISTLEKSLTPRFVAEIFLLFSIYFLLLKKHIVSPLVAGIGFLIQPVILLSYIPVAALSGIFENMSTFSFKNIVNIPKSVFKSVGSKILIFLLVGSPMLFKFISGQEGSVFIDAEWRSILYDRLPYIFIWRWSIINFVALFAICIFFAFYKRIFKQKLHPTVKAILFVSMAFFVAAFLSSVFDFRLGLQLQLTRNLYLLVVFTIIFGIGSFLARLSMPSLQKTTLAIIFFSVALSFPTRTEYGIFWINPLDDYQKAAIWAKNNTPKDSAFLVPLDEFGFRFWSKRSVFLEHKEGGDSLYDRSLAIEWNKREELIENNREFSGEYITTLKNEYNIDHIVTKQEIPGLAIVYRNSKFIIYRI